MFNFIIMFFCLIFFFRFFASFSFVYHWFVSLASRSMNFWRTFQVIMRRTLHFLIPKMAYEHHHVVPPYICQQSIFHLNRVSVVRLLVHFWVQCLMSHFILKLIPLATITIISIWILQSLSQKRKIFYSDIYINNGTKR